MSFAPGTRLGPYEILTLIGAGGMGEVYKARDTRLDRIVAVKTSKEQFSERFEREAHTVASLNHPHISTLYDVGPNYLVMEFIDGVPLKGPLPIDRVLEYAGQICDALEAAHRKGITHRDLKPGNIMVTRQGIKLLDFGLAKLREPPLNDSDETISHQPLTAAGHIVGTLQYMSPEQLQGRETDARSDIFSFGAVLYEMISGKRAFEGSDAASKIASVMNANPAPLPDVLPRALQNIVLTCLAKDPDERFQTARDLKRALEWAFTESPSDLEATRSFRGSWLLWAAAAIFAVAAAAIATIHFREPPAESRMMKFMLAPPAGSAFGYTALSPDGRRLAFQARNAQGQARLYVQSLDSLAPQPLPGTEGGSYPFWSPDNRFLGFFVGKQLKKIEASGGLAQFVCETDGSLEGAAWGPDGTILFPENLDGVYRVPAAGGQATRLTQLDVSRKETRHYWPAFLPDGRHFLYEVTSSMPEVQGVWVASLADPKDRRRLVPDSSQATFSQGHLLFVRGGNLMAQPFDPRSLQLSGEAVPLVDRVPFNPTVGWADFSSSDNGTIAIGAAARLRRMTWFDRAGNPLSSFGSEGLYQFLALSPDQLRLAADAQDSQAGYELFVVDLPRGTVTQLTFGADTGNFPVWSPDGTRIAYASSRDGVYNLYIKSSGGTSSEEVLLKNDRNKFLMDWSPDGKYLLFGERDPNTKSSDLWLLPMAGDRKPVLFLRGDADKREGRFSPDGHWVAYSSDESNRMQVYVQSFAAPSQRWQISTDGGSRPRWRDDGRELFYMEPEGRLMAVAVRDGTSFEAGKPAPLFNTNIANRLVTFDVAKGGQRFVMPVVDRNAPAGSVTVIVNFTAGVKK